MKIDSEYLAYHEAGHTLVYSLMFPGCVEQVSMNDLGGVSKIGLTVLTDHQNALGLIAGHAATDVLRNRRFNLRRFMRESFYEGSDFSKICDMFYDIHSIPNTGPIGASYNFVLDAWIKYMAERVAVQYIKPNLSTLDRLALRLLQSWNGTLSGDTVSEIMLGASEPPITHLESRTYCNVVRRMTTKKP